MSNPVDAPAIAVDTQVLSYLRIDHQVRLRFGGTEVVIECPFRLTIQGLDHQLDPEGRTGLGPLLGLYPDTLSSMGVAADGSLQLTFDSGAALTVPPHPTYEAWQVVGPDEQLVVCSPTGATLSVWP